MCSRNSVNFCDWLTNMWMNSSAFALWMGTTPPSNADGSTRGSASKVCVLHWTDNSFMVCSHCPTPRKWVVQNCVEVFIILHRHSTNTDSQWVLCQFIRICVCLGAGKCERTIKHAFTMGESDKAFMHLQKFNITHTELWYSRSLSVMHLREANISRTILSRTCLQWSIHTWFLLGDFLYGTSGILCTGLQRDQAQSSKTRNKGSFTRTLNVPVFCLFLAVPLTCVNSTIGLHWTHF